MQQWMWTDMKLNIPDITDKHWILIDIICSFTTHWSVNLPHETCMYTCTCITMQPVPDFNIMPSCVYITVVHYLCM